MVYVSMLLS